MKENKKDKIKDKMRLLLNKAGLSQIQCAKEAGVTKDLIGKAVTRGSTPRKKLDRDNIAKVLNTTSQSLWFGLPEESLEQKKGDIKIPKLKVLDVGQSAKIDNVEIDNEVRQVIYIFDNLSQSSHTHSK